jgi:hypothetical protein
MKNSFLAFILIFIMQNMHAQSSQLIFKANNPNSNSPKLQINTTTKKTILTLKSGSSTIDYTWNQVPKMTSDEDRVNTYQMVVTKSDKVAKRTFTISYSYTRDNQAYLAYVKHEIDFHDSRSTKIDEYNYTKSN